MDLGAHTCFLTGAELLVTCCFCLSVCRGGAGSDSAGRWAAGSRCRLAVVVWRCGLVLQVYPWVPTMTAGPVQQVPSSVEDLVRSALPCGPKLVACAFPAALATLRWPSMLGASLGASFPIWLPSRATQKLPGPMPRLVLPPGLGFNSASSPHCLLSHSFKWLKQVALPPRVCLHLSTFYTSQEDTPVCVLAAGEGGGLGSPRPTHFPSRQPQLPSPPPQLW